MNDKQSITTYFQTYFQLLKYAMMVSGYAVKNTILYV